MSMQAIEQCDLSTLQMAVRVTLLKSHEQSVQQD